MCEDKYHHMKTIRLILLTNTYEFAEHQLVRTYWYIRIGKFCFELCDLGKFL